MARTKIVFLYTELAGYFLACVKELSRSADILIVRWPVNREAPFKFNSDLPVEILNRKELNDQEMIEKVHKFNPGLLICSGWVDKGYLKVVKSFRKKIPCVLTLDNHWTGSLKQRIAGLISPFYLKRMFTHAWVPGQPQYKFAEKLGFGKSTLLNFYCADTILFKEKFDQTFESKKQNFPHRFLFVGRYVKHKGIFELWKAFIDLQTETPNDWELWCLGTGEEWANRVEHDKIKHIGFVQPNDMEKYIAETSVYILPSKFEPWGVTVQEFSACGFPILVSGAVGSKEKFLNGNGFEFEPGSSEEIKKALKKIINLDDDKLIEMGLRSHELGISLTPELWSKNLLSIIKP